MLPDMMFFFQSPSGPHNYLLTDVLHLIPDPIPWLRNAGTAMVPIMGLGIWKGIGWSMIIFLAALQTIPGELYKAVTIDEVGRWQRFWRLTLPLIRPTVVFVLVISGFNVFIPIYLITGGGPMKQ